jgi:hypothetical protein
MGQTRLSKLKCRGEFWHEVAIIKCQREVMSTRMGQLIVLFRIEIPIDSGMVLSMTKLLALFGNLGKKRFKKKT